MTKYVWDGADWVPAAQFRRAISTSAPMIQGDIDPYRSVVTGEVVGGRRQHREHLSVHGLVEVGNERLSPRRPEPLTPSIQQDLRASIEMVRSGHRPQRLDTYRGD